MKIHKIILLISVFVLFLVSSCDLISQILIDDELDEQKGICTSTIVLSENSNSDKSFRDRSSSEGSPIEVFFRSSTIEFWSVDTVSDISNLKSTYLRNANGQLASTDSLAFSLGDITKSLVFNNQTNTSSYPNCADNKYFPQYVQSFLDHDNSTINLARLDIGNGKCTWLVDGIDTCVRTVSGDVFRGLDANSILFVDSHWLSHSVMITRDLEHDLVNGTITSEQLGVSDSEYEVLKEIFKHSNDITDFRNSIDINGALVIPFDPISIANINLDNEHIEILCSWDMEDILTYNAGEYIISDRLDGTPFDFTIAINVVDGATLISQTEDIINPDVVFRSFPENGDSNIPIDSDIHIAFESLVDIDITRDNFTLTPEIPYEMYTRMLWDETDSVLTVELDDMACNTNYMVSISRINGEEVFSEPFSFSFTTGEARSQDPPSISHRPEITTTDHFPGSLNFSLNWSTVATANKYVIQYSESEVFSGFIKELEVNEPSLEITMTEKNQYYFRVRAQNDAEHYSEWSRIFCINTKQ